MWIESVSLPSHGMPPNAHSKSMHGAVLRPSPESLSKIIERYGKQAPKSDQAGVRHDRRHKTILEDPWNDELSEAVTPDVLVDRDSNHERSGNRFVRVDRVGSSHRRDGRDLDSSTSVANDDNCFPWPLLLIAKGTKQSVFVWMT